MLKTEKTKKTDELIKSGNGPKTREIRKGRHTTEGKDLWKWLSFASEVEERRSDA